MRIRTRPRSRTLSLLAAALIALALVLSSCSSAENTQVATLDEGSDQPSPTASSGGTDDGGLAFAKCMREQGVDFPDPDPEGGLGETGGALADLDLNDPTFTDALEACAAYRPAGSPLDQEFDEAAQEVAVKLTKCLRENGIDIPDAQFDANGKIIIGDLLKNVNISDPKFAKAIQECRKLLPTDLAGP